MYLILAAHGTPEKHDIIGHGQSPVRAVSGSAAC
jgi:hypothetical protein